MIKSFQNKGLQLFFEKGKKSGIQAKHAKRLRMQLTALDTAFAIDDMDIPGYRLHRLQGRPGKRWAIWGSGNWRLTFKFTEGDVQILNYEDYH